MRFAMVFIVVVVLGTWAWVSIQKGELQSIDTEVMGIVLGALGIKAYQRGNEQLGASIETKTSTTMKQ